MKKVLIPLCLFIVFVFSSVRNSFAQLIRDNIINVNGNERCFNVYLPDQLEDNSPAVIILHGGNGNKDKLLYEDRATSEWKAIADEKNVLLLLPNGSDDNGNTNSDKAHWNDCRSDDLFTVHFDDVLFISRLIDWAIENYSSDPERFYITGSSNGGMMSYRVGLELAHKTAGIAAFIANLPANSECAPENIPVSVFICNGTEDPLMPWSGGQIGEEFFFLENRGQVLSADSTLGFWKQYNHSFTLMSETEHEDINSSDSSTVSSVLFENLDTGIQVKFYTVSGGGHIMPSTTHHLDIPEDLQSLIGNQNKDIEGARHAWEFLKNQRLSNNFSRLSEYNLNGKNYKLYQNYPNPFNLSTEIVYEIPVSCLVHLDVYDVLGNRVTELVNERKQSGQYTAEFDGTEFASGIYFFQLRVGGIVLTRKCLLMK